MSDARDLDTATTRREFLALCTASTAAVVTGCAPAAARQAQPVRAAGRPVLRTGLCDLLGMEYPIVQSGMGGVAGPELVAAVSNAGGLGIIGGAHLAPDELRRRIRRVRELTSRPFGVNLLMHSQMYPPADVARIGDDVVGRIQSTLDRFRARLGIPPQRARPEPLPDIVGPAFEVILDERVAVFSIGLGCPPAEMVRRCHAQGMRVIAMIATVDDARRVAASGVDAIVVQGGEAGGHRSSWVKPASADRAVIGTLALVPQVVDAVPLPVIAAGGISDGRGVAAALALGATGALIGTRFVATSESTAAPFYKRALVAAGADDTTITDAYTGIYARVLRSVFIEEYEASGAPVLPAYVQSRAARDVFAAALAREDADHYPMWAGQGVGMIRDLPGADAVLQSLVRETLAVLDGLGHRVRRA